MAGSRHSHKRKRDHYAEEGTSHNGVGMGETLAHLRQEASDRTLKDAEGEDSGEWEIVKPKRQKKQNYPGLGYSNLHQLQSMVRLGDLQSLMLYCLADGPSPQWLSVSHHGMVKKAVVLFVPGLEKGMFDGSIPLREPEQELHPSSQSLSNGGDEASLHAPAAVSSIALEATPHLVANNAQSNRFTKFNHGSNPDDYLPQNLESSQLPDPLKPFADMFPHVWPIKAPGDDRSNKVHSPLQAILQSPLTKSQEEKQAEKGWKGPKPAKESKDWKDKRTKIVEYLASGEELLENEYVLHPACWQDAGMGPDKENERRRVERQTASDGWVDTRVSRLEDGTVPESEIEYGSVTAGRKVLSIDCEMCTVQGGGSALTKISVVDWDGEVVMDEFVMPETPIIDFLTPYSGITPAKLENITTSIADIQTRLLSTLTPRTIIVGHSLNSDLAALKLTHPFIIDTSLLYPHPRGPPMKSSLKWLSQKYLSREIQKGHGATGHDSIEDSRACLDLVKAKCEKGPQWGTQEATVEPIFKRLKRSSANASLSKSGAIVDHGAPEKNFGQMADFSIGCSNDEQVVAGTKRAILGDDDGAYIPGAGVLFTWARLRELEFLRGWRNDDVIQPSPTILAQAVSRTVANIQAIHAVLPPCTLFIVYSGTGDPRAMARLQERHRAFKRDYRVKKWDEIADKWTDTEEQALKEACRKAREGVGLLCIT